MKRKIIDTLHLNNIYKKFKLTKPNKNTLTILDNLDNQTNQNCIKKLVVENKKRKSRNNTPKNDKIHTPDTNSIVLIPNIPENKQKQHNDQRNNQRNNQYPNKKYISKSLSKSISNTIANTDSNLIYNQNKKEQIPKRIREMVWNTYNDEKYSSKCYVFWCNNIINVFNYQVGHDIPESKGGTLDLSNLKPICGNCNLSMGNKYTITEWCKLINKTDTNKQLDKLLPDKQQLDKQQLDKLLPDKQQLDKQPSTHNNNNNNNLTYIATILLIIMHIIYI